MAAAEAGCGVTLLSAPGAAASAGPAWFAALVRAVREEFPALPLSAILDCGGAPGHALSALREGGIDAVRLTASEKVLAKVAAIALQSGARLDRGHGAALDLLHVRDPLAACRACLAEATPNDGGAMADETRRCRLYLVTPAQFEPTAFAHQLGEGLAAGDVACLQIRLKDADDGHIRRAVDILRPLAQSHDVAVLLNDRADLAAETGCDGVHIGQQDVSYEEARRLVGAEAIVGVTCHDSRHLAIVAADAGADYVAFGAFHPTTTKAAKSRAHPSILQWWSHTMSVQCVAIGGITADNCRHLAQAGADFVAVSAGVWAHPDGPAAAVASLTRILAEK